MKENLSKFPKMTFQSQNYPMTLKHIISFFTSTMQKIMNINSEILLPYGWQIFLNDE